MSDEQIDRINDSINLIWSELNKLNIRVENLGNWILEGEKPDDGK